MQLAVADLFIVVISSDQNNEIHVDCDYVREGSSSERVLLATGDITFHSGLCG